MTRMDLASEGFASPRPHRNHRYAGVQSPKPTLSSLMLKVIARVRALK